MRKLIAAIAAALAAMGRTVWTKCKETGAWVASTVFGGSGGLVAAGAYDDDDATGDIDEAPASLDHVRALAAAISNGCVRPEMLEAVDERTFEWLSVLDRGMIAKVLLADDASLRAHMRGQRSIKGVVQADEASVSAYRAALERKVQHDAEPDEPAMAYA